MNKKILLIIVIGLIAALAITLSKNLNLNQQVQYEPNNSINAPKEEKQPEAKTQFKKEITSKLNKQENSTYQYQGEFAPSTPMQEAIAIMLSKEYEQKLSDLVALAQTNPDNTMIQYLVIAKCRETNEKCYMEPFIKNILNQNPDDALAKGLLTNHYLNLGNEQKALDTFSGISTEDSTFAYFQEIVKATIENYKNKIKIKNPDNNLSYPQSENDILVASVGGAARGAISYASLFKVCKKYIEHTSWRDACHDYGTVYKKNNHTLMDLTMGDAYQRLATNQLETDTGLKEYIRKLSITMGKVESSGKFTNKQKQLYLNDLFEHGEEVAMLKLFERLGFEY